METKLYSVRGNSQKLDGGAMFGNAPRALWSRWLPPDELNRVELACTALLVVEPKRRILFEAGIGVFFEPTIRERYGVQETTHVLVEELRRLGHDHESIDAVVLSHLHFDHAGGILAPWREGRPLELLFPRARFVVSRAAWDRANAPHLRDRASFIPELPSLLTSTGRLEIVDGSVSEVLGAEYRLRLSHGHTPGMLLAEIPAANGPILFAADLIPGRPWIRKAITMGYDRFPELLIEEKGALLENLVKRKGRVFFTHDTGCVMAGVTLDEKGQFTTIDEHAHLNGC